MSDDIENQLTNLFSRKRATIQNTISQTTSMIGQRVDTITIPPTFITIARNIGDLYDIHENVIKSMFALKKDMDELAQQVKQLHSVDKRTTKVEKQVQEMGRKYDETLGPLGDVISKIKKRDEQGEKIAGYE
jgi:DNA repair ATPase RecN